MSAAESLRAGDLDTALQELQSDVRREPGKANHRIFLFQLLTVMGQWERAVKQLQLIAELDPSALPMVQTYREAIRCELLRREVFAGQRAPMLMGEPAQWVALLLEALRLSAEGEHGHAHQLREEAFELAPTTSGKLDDDAFAWIADADMRLGPIFEVIVNGRYYWLPYGSIASVQIEQASDLRDLAWMAGVLTLANGGEMACLIPTRYPGSEEDGDGLIRLARKTTWSETPGGDYYGLGQRILTTDAGERPLMDIRLIALDTSGEPEQAESDG